MKRLLRVAISAALVLAAVASPVSAAGPTIQRYTSVYDAVYGPCPDGSPIDVHITYNVTRWFFPDRQLSTVQESGSYTKRSTGQIYNQSAHFFETLYLDPTSDTGSSGAFLSGLFAHAAPEGSGLLTIQAGHWIANADGDYTSEVGVNVLHGFDLCAWHVT
jgi:hypothetical protein